MPAFDVVDVPHITPMTFFWQCVGLRCYDTVPNPARSSMVVLLDKDDLVADMTTGLLGDGVAA